MKGFYKHFEQLVGYLLSPIRIFLKGKYIIWLKLSYGGGLRYCLALLLKAI